MDIVILDKFVGAEMLDEFVDEFMDDVIFGEFMDVDEVRCVVILVTVFYATISYDERFDWNCSFTMAFMTNRL